MKWWAYKHTNDSIQVKRYLKGGDMEYADSSPFVQKRTEPFEAENRERATIIAEEVLKELGNDE